MDPDFRILAGHGRLEAAKKEGLREVPVIVLHGMADAEKIAFALADNRIAENAGWDRELLRMELQEVMELDASFDLGGIGFEMAEIDILLNGSAGEGPEDEEADWLPDPTPELPIVTKRGDLWLLGEHRLLCDDATRPEAFQRLMAGEKAQIVFMDPPYNIPISGHVSGLGKVQHSEFAMASGEMSESDFAEFLTVTHGNTAKNCMAGAIVLVCMDWRHLDLLIQVGRSVFGQLLNLCIWNKTNAGMGSLYRSQHECIPVFQNGRGPHINNVELGRHGRNRSNVWTYAGMNSFGRGRGEALGAHPTVKPTVLVRDAILDCSNLGGIVLDPFAGSGTTIIAAERARRRAFAMEIEGKYVDIALRRFRKLTGQEPIHAGSGMTFAERERTAVAESEVEAPVRLKIPRRRLRDG